jgi:hypothetical protein
MRVVLSRRTRSVVQLERCHHCNDRPRASAVNVDIRRTSLNRVMRWQLSLGGPGWQLLQNLAGLVCRLQASERLGPPTSLSDSHTANEQRTNRSTTATKCRKCVRRMINRTTASAKRTTSGVDNGRMLSLKLHRSISCSACIMLFHRHALGG